MAAETGTPAERYEAVKQSHPKLAELCHQAGAELDEIALRDYAVPDRARRREMHDWSKRNVDSDDAELIAGAIEEAYANQPRNWAVLAVGLGAARRGVVDNRVLPIARDLVSSAARLPDDAMMAVGAALPILALSRAREDVNLLVKATSRTYVGVETKNVDFVSSHRELLCQGAVQALYLYAPLDKSISGLKHVRDSFRADSTGFDGYIRGVAESYLEQLARVRLGQAVKLPVPTTNGK